MSKNYTFANNNVNDYYLSAGYPKLIGLNMTEWWWAKELMKHQKCKYSTSGYRDIFETIVTIPGGDSYNITEYSEIVMKVEKLQREA